MTVWQSSKRTKVITLFLLTGCSGGGACLSIGIVRLVTDRLLLLIHLIHCNFVSKVWRVGWVVWICVQRKLIGSY